MTYSHKINSPNHQEIIQALHELLKDVTPQNVSEFDDEVLASDDPTSIFKEFEARSANLPLRDPLLLEKWTHFRWLKLEIMHIGFQRATLNRKGQIGKMLTNLSHTETSLSLPSFPDTVARAIQEDAQRGVSIEKSIQTLSKICLQIVSTEHPTDPLSQRARNLLTQIANQLDLPIKVKTLLHELQNTDPIPPYRRDVEEEVNRNIDIALDKLYDSVPHLVESIVVAYKTYYGKEAFTQHQEAIFAALERGPIVHDASWPGFDADGNDNITPQTMRLAIRLHRIRVTEKHCKQIDRLIHELSSLKPTAEISNGFVQLVQKLEEFKETLERYKTTVREDTDAFELKDEHDKPQSPTVQMVLTYKDILKPHEKLLARFPVLHMQFICFGLQLSCFGMTYGTAHMRQDSSVHVNVWTAIFADLQSDKQFAHFRVIQLLNSKNYADLDAEQRLKVHKQLQNNDAESKMLLRTIESRYRAGVYAAKKKKDFDLVVRELERTELVVRHYDLFENVIISNTKNSANIFEVESLRRVFTATSWSIVIVPLLEERQDLQNCRAILTDFIKARIQFLDKEQVRDITIEVMFGYSDTERVSGLPALIPIKRAQEEFQQLANQFGVRAKFFYGPGGDPNRGGLKRRDEKGTLQGNARSTVLTTPQSTKHYRESQFYGAYKQHAEPQRFYEVMRIPSYLQHFLKLCEEEGAKFYEHLHDTENGLGKLLGFMLGQGVPWMVEILNSSSRASQRGIAEKNSDRTAAVQSNGIRPEAYIDPNKPRAITATQIKEMLRDNIHLIMGTGFGLRKLGLEGAQRLYDTSATVRDMVHKLTYGLSTANLSITALALFGNRRDLIAKDAEQRKAWAAECANFPALLKNMDVKKMAATSEGREKLLVMMSRFFAYIEEEYLATRDFVFQLNRLVHRWEYRQKSAAPKEIGHPTDLLFHYPNWQHQARMLTDEVGPLNHLLAMQNFYVAQGLPLDQVYVGLNNNRHANTRLTGIGRLLGNVGAGITAFRVMPSAFYETCYLDYSENLRGGITRGTEEARRYGLSIYGRKKPVPEIKMPVPQKQLQAKL